MQQANPVFHPARRVLVGLDGNNASTVIEDARDLPLTHLPNGILLQELWQQRSIPAAHNDLPEPAWTLGPDAPTEGAVVRILTVPPGHGSGSALPDLHSDPSLHVITMLDGDLTVVVETGAVTLSQGDSIVLRDNKHDLSNPQSRPATFVYTSFPLVSDVGTA